MKEKRLLSSAHLSYQCPLRLKDFSKSGDAYYCGKCDREILDLTDCSIEDAIKLQQSKGVICGLVYAAGAAAILSNSSCSAIRDGDIRDQPKPGKIESRPIAVPGILCPPEQLKRLNENESSASKGE